MLISVSIIFTNFSINLIFTDAIKNTQIEIYIELQNMCTWYYLYIKSKKASTVIQMTENYNRFWKDLLCILLARATPIYVARDFLQI